MLRNSEQVLRDDPDMQDMGKRMSRVSYKTKDETKGKLSEMLVARVSYNAIVSKKLYNKNLDFVTKFVGP